MKNLPNCSFVHDPFGVKKKGIDKIVIPLKPLAVLPAGRADIERFFTPCGQLFFDQLGDTQVPSGPTSGDDDQSLAFLLTISTIPTAMESAIMELPP